MKAQFLNTYRRRDSSARMYVYVLLGMTEAEKKAYKKAKGEFYKEQTDDQNQPNGNPLYFTQRCYAQLNGNNVFHKPMPAGINEEGRVWIDSSEVEIRDAIAVRQTALATPVAAPKVEVEADEPDPAPAGKKK